MGVRVVIAALCCALLAPASASAQKPYVDTRGDRPTRAVIAGGGTAGPQDYLRTHRAQLGLSAAAIDALGAPETATGPGGLRQVRWTQSYRGIPAFGGGVQVNLDARGRALGAFGAAQRGLRVPSVVPALDAPAALRRAMALDGGAGSVTVTGGPTGPRRDTSFPGGARARLVLFPDGSSVRLAWRVEHSAGPLARYDTVIDASTGALLHRANLVRQDRHADVWDYYPGAPAGGTARTQDLTALGFLDGSATTLINQWLHAYSDGAEVAPANGDYRFTFVPSADCAFCSWSPSDPTSWRTNRSQDAVQAFYLANVYRSYLFTLDFPAALRAGSVQVLADDGADNWQAGNADNASMETAAPGGTSIMRMYVWGADPHFRAVDGGDDASILFHEYTHWFTDRLVHDQDGLTALNGPQAGAMAEGFSDWYAKAFLAHEGYQPDDPHAPGEVNMGVYTDAVPNSIRTEPMDCPVGAATAVCPHGGYTYGDFGAIGPGGPEVHADGEIWAQALWDLRNALGFATATKVVTDALPLAPQEPSFLDMRDAILQAAEADNVSTDTVWSIFAARGMGIYAATEGSHDTAPVEDFMAPPVAGTPTGAISGTVTDADSRLPVAGVTVAVGGATSGTYAHSAVTDASGNYIITGVPAARYGRLVFTPASAVYEPVSIAGVQVPGAGAVNVDAAVSRDWAAAGGGGRILESNETTGAPFGCGPDQLVDGDDATGWSAAFDPTAAAPEATVALPAPVDLTRLEVLPVGLCGDDEGSAASGYRIDVATSSTGPFRTILQGTLAPGTANRLTLSSAGRYYSLGARYVRLTLTSPQDARSEWVDVAELRVFGAPPGILPVPPAPPVNPTPTPAPTPPVGIPPAPAAPAQPGFALKASGRRGVAFTVSCHALCNVIGTLSVDKKTAKRLKLGSRRVVGKLTARLSAAGTRTYTVKLNRAAAKALKRAKRVRSFRATLTAQAGYPGAVIAHKQRAVTVRR